MIRCTVRSSRKIKFHVGRYSDKRSKGCGGKSKVPRERGFFSVVRGVQGGEGSPSSMLQYKFQPVGEPAEAGTPRG